MMRIPILSVSAAVFLSASISCSAADAASVAPCTEAAQACEQWITFGDGSARSMVYSTYPLETPNPAITRALIMVHGAGRNADHYFETATAAAFLARALDNTIVIAPRFAAGRDSVAANEVLWPPRGDSWRSGGMSPSNPELSSFDFADEILRRLADKKIFPNLAKIVVAGHSAGGQFATRYGMASKVHDSLGVEVSYVVANPSSYAWPVASRPLPVGDANRVDA
jgi:pimeloyl-ACP methyl ester carboxylesterase